MSTTTTTALETQLSDQLDAYITSFNARDFTTAAIHYNKPAVSISSTGVTILPQRRDLAAFLCGTVDRLRKDGFDRSEWMGPKKLIVLHAGLLLVSCACRRMRRDGSSCEEFGVTYTLRKEGERWLIAGILHHEVETRLRGD